MSAEAAKKATAFKEAAKSEYQEAASVEALVLAKTLVSCLKTVPIV